MGDDLHTGQEALLRSQASRHMTWNRCLHSGIKRSISPFTYSQRQMEHMASPPAAALEKGALGYDAMAAASRPTGDEAAAAAEE
jgi:hypothetical protein